MWANVAAMHRGQEVLFRLESIGALMIALYLSLLIFAYLCLSLLMFVFVCVLCVVVVVVIVFPE